MATTKRVPKKDRHQRQVFRAPSFEQLPLACPGCGRMMPNRPVAGAWVKHRLTGFHGVQCSECGQLVEVVT